MIAAESEAEEEFEGGLRGGWGWGGWWGRGNNELFTGRLKAAACFICGRYCAATWPSQWSRNPRRKDAASSSSSCSLRFPYSGAPLLALFDQREEGGGRRGEGEMACLPIGMMAIS